MLGLPPTPDSLADALRSCRRHFLTAAGFSALLNILFIAPMLYMLQIYDRVVPTQGRLTLFFLTIVVLFALATLSLLDLYRSRLLVRAGVRLDRQLAAALMETMFGGAASGNAKRQALREFDTLRQALTGSAILALFDAPWTPVYILLCAIIHPWLGVLALAGALAILLVARRTERAIDAPLTAANKAAAEAYASHDQSIAAADAVRALGMQDALVQRHLLERETMTALQTRASLAAGSYAALGKFIRLLLQSLALGLGAWLAINEKISPGAIFAATFLVGRALAPMDQLLGAWRSVQQARGAWVLLTEVFEARDEHRISTLLPAPAGRIAAEHIVLGNAAGDGYILADVSFAIAPGQVVAVVGPSGAGKSSLLRVLSGAIEPSRGTVRVDGADAADWDRQSLAAHIGYLPQELSLFAGTVKENIVRFRNHIEMDRAQIDTDAVAAAQAAGAHHMILRLSDGYDTRLGSGGRGVSAGQAQRIGLARALFRDPGIMLLDEPNAHLDAEGESHLLQTLAQVKERGGAALVVAHRMGILGVVDKIMVMRDGRVDAFGDRDEILGKIRSVPAPSETVPAEARG